MNVPFRPVVHVERQVIGEVAAPPGGVVALRLDILDPAFGDDLGAVPRAALHQKLPDKRQVARRQAHAARRAGASDVVNGDVAGMSSAERAPDAIREKISVAPASGAFENPAEEVGDRRYIVKALAMLAVLFHQLVHERSDVARLDAHWHGVPVGGVAIIDDGAFGREIIFIKKDANPHVQSVSHRGAVDNRIAQFGDVVGDQRVKFQIARSDQRACKQAKHGFRNREQNVRRRRAIAASIAFEDALALVHDDDSVRVIRIHRRVDHTDVEGGRAGFNRPSVVWVVRNIG